jgi:hypothetical protein
MNAHSPSPATSTLGQLMIHYQQRIRNVIGRLSTTESGEKIYKPTTIFSKEFMEFFRTLRGKQMKGFIESGCHITFTRRNDKVLVQVRDDCKNGKHKSDVNLENLPHIYKAQLNTPWPDVVHVFPSKKRKALHQQPEDEVEATDKKEEEIKRPDDLLVDQDPLRPPRHDARKQACSEGLSKMKGTASSTERAHVDKVLKLLKKKVIEDDLDGPPEKLRRLVKAMAQRLKVMKTEKQMKKHKERYKFNKLLLSNLRNKIPQTRSIQNQASRYDYPGGNNTKYVGNF